MYSRAKATGVRADWFTHRKVIDRIDRASHLIARDYLMMIPVTADDIMTDAIGICEHYARRIQLNPLGVYKLADVSDSVIARALGREDEVKAFELPDKLKTSGYGSHDVFHVQDKARQWLRDNYDMSRRKEWAFCQAVAYHERLHERFTSLDVEKIQKEAEANNNRLRHPFQLWHHLWNALEDERIERLGSNRWDRVKMFIRILGHTAWRLSHERLEVQLASESRTEALVTWILYMRHALRVGPYDSFEDAKDVLNPRWHDHADRVRPLVLEAWNEASTADRVWELAGEILDIIAPQEEAQEVMDALMDLLEDCDMGNIGTDSQGERSMGGQSESPGLGEQEKDPEQGSDGRSGSSGDGDEDEEDERDEGEGGGGGDGDEDEDELPDPSQGGGGDTSEDEDLESVGTPSEDSLDPDAQPLPSQSSSGDGSSGGGIGDPGKYSEDQWTRRANYHDLLARPEIANGLKKIRRCFELPSPDAHHETRPSGSMGKLSAKQFRKDRSKPFLRRNYDDPKQDRIYLQILVDWSGSMASNRDAKGRTRAIEFARRMSVMCLAALEDHPDVDVELRLMPHDIFVATNRDGDAGLMRAAGVIAQSGTEYYSTIKAAHERAMRRAHDSHCLIWAVADGAITDQDKRKTRRLREQCEQDGISLKCMGICNDRMDTLNDAFGKDNFLLVPDVANLVREIEKMMMALGARTYSSVYR